MDGAGVRTVEAAALAGRPLRHFDLVMAAFVTILLLSNVLGAGKVAVIDVPGLGAWPFGAGILFFPVTYAAAGWLKAEEGVDVYDTGTDFTPFRTRV